MKKKKQILIVRSLAESDLGIFRAHRPSEKSRQRAININSEVACRILSAESVQQGDAKLSGLLKFHELQFEDTRRLKKTGKNWRLGGEQILGDKFGKLDAKDFMLLRTFREDGPACGMTLAFVSRRLEPVPHAGIASVVERRLKSSMAVFEEGSYEFDAISPYCTEPKPNGCDAKEAAGADPIVPPIPDDPGQPPAKRTPSVKDKVRSPWIMERMFQLAGDLSGPAQLEFIQTVQALAEQLREVLLHTGQIVRLNLSHKKFWPTFAGKPIGFIDGGLANLAMVGSAPLAARVGAYVVVPGASGPEREDFRMVKELIDDLFEHPDGGVFEGTFPDYGALRDAARISIEAAGGVRLLEERPNLDTILLHGALVNPVSRYSDVMSDGKVVHAFPSFSDKALQLLLPSGHAALTGRAKNFINVYLRQLEALQKTHVSVGGIVEREGTSCTVTITLLQNLKDSEIADVLPEPPSKWKAWFKKAVKPYNDDEMEGQRISDSLLFRCLLHEGEALLPVAVDRNELRRAPDSWKDIIRSYPKPYVSFVQISEWSAPVRVEIFEKDVGRFNELAELVLHSSRLLPRYAFPAGLDIVDKFAHIPNWMSRQANTRATVQALASALDQKDFASFDAIRRFLCGSEREWLLRPGLFK